MTARYQDFTVTAGDDMALEVTVTDGAGSAVDLTGVAARWEAHQDGTAKVQKSIAGGGITLSGPTEGQLTVVIDAADTADLAGGLSHQLEIVGASGRTRTVTTGLMTVEPDLIPAP